MTAAPGDRRTRVLDAAVELFAEQGYDATSVAQVIARAGVAKGGFYHHFASKEALLYEVYGDLITRQLAADGRDPGADGLPPATTLRALIVDLVESTAAQRRAGAGVLARDAPARRRAHRRSTAQARRRYHDAVHRADPRRAGVGRVRRASRRPRPSRSRSSA